MSEIKDLMQKRHEAIDAFRHAEDPEPQKRAWQAATDIATEIDEKLDGRMTELDSRLAAIEEAEARARQVVTDAKVDLDPIWSTREGFSQALRDLAQNPGSRLKVPFVPDDVLREARSDTPMVLAGTTTYTNYLIPTILWQDLTYHLNASSGVLRAGPTIIRTPGDATIEVPVLLTDATATAGAEVTAATDSTYPVFSKVSLKAYREEGFMTISEEMARSSDFPFMQIMNDVANRALATKAASDYCLGAGSTVPDGLFIAAKADCNARFETAGSQTTFTPDELLAVKYNLIPEYRARASWVVSSPAMQVIAGWKNGVGDYQFQPSIIAGEPDRLFGSPIYEDAHADANGAIATGEEHVIYGDISRFWIRYAGGIDIGASRDMRFNEWEIVFRFALWHDCNVVDVLAFAGLTQA